MAEQARDEKGRYAAAASAAEKASANAKEKNTAEAHKQAATAHRDAAWIASGLGKTYQQHLDKADRHAATARTLTASPLGKFADKHADGPPEPWKGSGGTGSFRTGSLGAANRQMVAAAMRPPRTDSPKTFVGEPVVPREQMKSAYVRHAERVQKEAGEATTKATGGTDANAHEHALQLHLKAENAWKQAGHEYRDAAKSSRQKAAWHDTWLKMNGHPFHGVR